MSKHTAGPWKYTKCPCGHKSCSQFFISNQGSVGFEEDDARLICAAPDLLEALKLARSIIGHPDDAHSKLIDAAIAKAEGL